MSAPFILLLRLFGIRFQTASVTYIRFLSSKSNLNSFFSSGFSGFTDVICMSLLFVGLEFFLKIVRLIRTLLYYYLLLLVHSNITHVFCCYWSYKVLHLHICDWLITTKSNIQRSIRTTVTKLGMWVAVQTGITHVFWTLSMRILKTSFAYSPKVAHTVYSVNIVSA